MMLFRGQSAIEYLMTYGWMLLVVAIAGGAVFSVAGDQSIEGVMGFDSQELNVQDFGVSLENGLMFSMSDPIGQTRVTKVNVSDSLNVAYIIDQDVSEQNMVNLPGIIPSDDENSLEVEITYDSDNLENLTTSGTVTGGLEVDENFENRTMIADGLVGYWPFDEIYSSESTVYDLSKNDNHGSMGGNPNIVDGFVGGQALEFKDDDRVLVGDIESSSSLNLGQEFSVSFWSKPFEEGSGLQGVISTGGMTNTWNVRNNDGEMQFRVYSQDTYTSSENVDVGEFTHWSFVMEGDNWRWYKNGEEVNSGHNSYDFVYENMYIGRYHGYETFPGTLEDINIYDRVLSEDDVKILYRQAS